MVKKTVEKLVSIVIVTRNRRKITLDCLESVFKMNYSNFEVILVDNGSTDGTVEHIKNQKLKTKNTNKRSLISGENEKLKIIGSKENLGLNAGKNLGQKRAKGDYILFLDSDTLVDRKLLTELVELAKTNPKIGIVCPKMYYHQPRSAIAKHQTSFIWYAGSFVNLWTSQTKNIGVNEEDKGQWDQTRETQFAPTAYLVTRKAVEKLKSHDEELFMTYGDTDYGFQAQKMGFKVMFCPQARLWHRIKMRDNTKTIRALGYNLPMRAYYFARNRVIFMKRHAPGLNFVIFMMIFFPLFTLYINYKIIIFGGGWQFLKPHWQGSFDGLKYAFGGRVKNYWT